MKNKNISIITPKTNNNFRGSLGRVVARQNEPKNAINEPVKNNISYKPKPLDDGILQRIKDSKAKKTNDNNYPVVRRNKKNNNQYPLPVKKTNTNYYIEQNQQPSNFIDHVKKSREQKQEISWDKTQKEIIVPLSPDFSQKSNNNDENNEICNDNIEKNIVVDDNRFVVEIPTEKPLTSLPNSYSVRWMVIDSAKIINLCSPESIYWPKNWSENELEYRNTVGAEYIRAWNETNGFYKKLEESILKDGFRNPIIITAGHPQIRKLTEIPPELRVEPSEMLVCEILGGSRLHIAQKLGIAIPCIVNDWVNRFPNALKLNTNKDIKKAFSDPPDLIYFTEKGVRTSHPKHIHLEKEYRDPKLMGKYRAAIINKRIAKIEM